jgi:hypothetical protein
VQKARQNLGGGGGDGDGGGGQCVQTQVLACLHMTTPPPLQMPILHRNIISFIMLHISFNVIFSYIYSTYMLAPV